MKFQNQYEFPCCASLLHEPSTTTHHRKSLSVLHAPLRIPEKHNRRFPFEIFSSGPRSNFLAKRKGSNLLSAPDLPTLKASIVNFEEMEQLKKECRQIINGSPLCELKRELPKKLPPLKIDRASVLTSPVKDFDSTTSKNSNSDHDSLASFRSGIAPRKSSLTPLFLVKKTRDQFRQTACFKPMIGGDTIIASKLRKSEAASAPLKKDLGIRLKLEKEVLDQIKRNWKAKGKENRQPNSETQTSYYSKSSWTTDSAESGELTFRDLRIIHNVTAAPATFDNNIVL